jgi:uncharacterized coiled-coil protein SlyX
MAEATMETSMADEPDSLVLRYLRRIDQRLERVEQDVGDLKLRMTNLEQRVASGFSQLELTLATQSRRLDRVDERLGRIERRLDLVDAPLPLEPV